MSNLEKALSLAWLSAKVFPVHERDEWVGTQLFEIKTPRIANGHLKATGDKDQITKWWTTPGWENSAVGVHAGPSRIICLDIDNKDGRDGWHSLMEAGIEPPESLAYRSNSGGTHILYRAPEGFAFNGTKNHRTPEGVVLDGVDRRSGSSFFVFWGDDIPWDLRLTDAPDFLLTPTNLVTGSAFNGTVEDWIATLPAGDISAKVMAEMGKVPLDEDFGHDELIRMQASLVHLGAEGESGVPEALEFLREQWLREPYNTDANKKDFQVSLVGGIRKFGGAIEEVAPSADVTLSLIESVKDGEAKSLIFDGLAIDRPRLVELLLAEMPAEDAAAIIDTNKAMKGNLSYADILAECRQAGEKTVELTSVAYHPAGITLLEDGEREHLEGVYNFIDHYVHLAEADSIWDNSQYHRINAWNLLAVVLAPFGWVKVNKGMDLNLFTMTLGPSGSGKSHAYEMMKSIMDHAAVFNRVDIGGDATGEALHTALLNRDGEASWFNSDEAATMFKRMVPDRNGIVQGTFESMVTDFYGGWVRKKLRQGDKENSNKSARCYLTMWMTSTEADIVPLLRPQQMASGFLARFNTAFGPETVIDESMMDTIYMDEDEDFQGLDKRMIAFAEEYRELDNYWYGGNRRAPLSIEMESRARMDQARRKSFRLIQDHPLFYMLQPSLKRFMESMWKAAGLTAMSNLRERIILDDVLVAIRAGEEWLGGFIRLAESIQASDFTRQMSLVEKFISSKTAVQKSVLYRHLYERDGLTQRDVDSVTDNLMAQGKIKFDQKRGWLGTAA